MSSTILGLLLTAVFLSSCGAPQEQATVDASQVPTPEEVPPTTVEEVAPQIPTTMKEVPRISAEELKERIDNGEAIVIGDTRVQSVFDINHIAGAISIPSTEVEALLDDLPLDQEIVLYCACRNEEASASVALTMYENGYENVSVLLGGLGKWIEAGYPVDEAGG